MSNIGANLFLLGDAIEDALLEGAASAADNVAGAGVEAPVFVSAGTTGLGEGGVVLNAPVFISAGSPNTGAVNIVAPINVFAGTSDDNIGGANISVPAHVVGAASVPLVLEGATIFAPVEVAGEAYVWNEAGATLEAPVYVFAGDATINVAGASVVMDVEVSGFAVDYLQTHGLVYIPGLNFFGDTVVAIAESLVLADTPQLEVLTQIKEHLVARIQQQSQLIGLATTTELLIARVEVFLPIVTGIVEELELTDSLDALTIRLIDVAQEIYLSSDVSTLAQFSAATVLYLSARDAAMAGYNLTSSEALELDAETLAALGASADSFVDLVVASAASANARLTVTTTDSLEVDSEVDTLAQLIAQVDEGLEAHITVRVGEEVIHGWVVNTQNAAFSEYQNFPFNSLMEYEGRYYGLAADGLYLLAGDTDEGAEISAAIKTGLLDMGTHFLKDAKAAHLGYNSTGEMVLKVITTDAGEKVEHWYKMKPAAAEEVRDGRVVIGRGLRARYWQFELVNVAGADFEVDDVTLLYQVLSRRIRS